MSRILLKPLFLQLVFSTHPRWWKKSLLQVVEVVPYGVRQPQLGHVTPHHPFPAHCTPENNRWGNYINNISFLWNCIFSIFTGWSSYSRLRGWEGLQWCCQGVSLLPRMIMISIKLLPRMIMVYQSSSSSPSSSSYLLCQVVSLLPTMVNGKLVMIYRSSKEMLVIVKELKWPRAKLDFADHW